MSKLEETMVLVLAKDSGRILCSGVAGTVTAGAVRVRGLT